MQSDVKVKKKLKEKLQRGTKINEKLQTGSKIGEVTDGAPE